MNGSMSKIGVRPSVGGRPEGPGHSAHPSPLNPALHDG